VPTQALLVNTERVVVSTTKMNEVKILYEAPPNCEAIQIEKYERSDQPESEVNND